jgi:N utilization substance protein B
MLRRSRAREVTLQLLFQHDLNPTVPRSVTEAFARDRLKDAEMERFCLGLLDGVVARRAQIDQRLSAAAENWRLPRMTVVDRNVLRLAAYEMLYADVPPSAAINEAIELARRFGSKDSPGFVNGVLDKVKSEKPTADNPPT